MGFWAYLATSYRFGHPTNTSVLSRWHWQRLVSIMMGPPSINSHFWGRKFIVMTFRWLPGRVRTPDRAQKRRERKERKKKRGGKRRILGQSSAEQVLTLHRPQQFWRNLASDSTECCPVSIDHILCRYVIITVSMNCRCREAAPAAGHNKGTVEFSTRAVSPLAFGRHGVTLSIHQACPNHTGPWNGAPYVCATSIG
jgi:hypothetical protein